MKITRAPDVAGNRSSVPRALTYVLRAKFKANGRRSAQPSALNQHDDYSIYPFLMVDEFTSAEGANDSGFADSMSQHNIDVVTYLLNGSLSCFDFLQETGTVRSGEAHWTAAGRGPILYEQLGADTDELHGFQIWVHSTSSPQTESPVYLQRDVDEIPVVATRTGAFIKAIIGKARIQDKQVVGAMPGKAMDLLVLDIALLSHATVSINVPTTHTALTYLFEGEIVVDDERTNWRSKEPHYLGAWTTGDTMDIKAGALGARLLLIAAEPNRVTPTANMHSLPGDLT